VTLEMMLLLIITMEMELINRTAALNIGGTAARTNFINTDSRLVWGESGMQYFNIVNATGSRQVLNQTPDGNWWHIIRMNHANGAGYYDLAGMTTANAEVRVRS
jgi:hypothetical protein